MIAEAASLVGHTLTLLFNVLQELLNSEQTVKLITLTRGAQSAMLQSYIRVGFVTLVLGGGKSAILVLQGLGAAVWCFMVQ